MRNYLEQVAVELVMFASGGALDVVPPIAGEELLAEDGTVGAEERVLPTADVANVKHLLKKEERQTTSTMNKPSSQTTS